MAPALACGNTIVYKPSELTPLTALAMAQLAVEAGIPPGVFNVVQVWPILSILSRSHDWLAFKGNGETGAHLCRHQDVAKISFTGSVSVGKKIMQLGKENKTGL